MALLSALATDTIALHTINVSGGYGRTRLYYCTGLLLAGFIADKNKNHFGILTIVSFIFSLLSIILLKDGYSIKLIAALSYLFVAFFVLFRTTVFVNLIDKRKNICWAAAFGLMYSRIIEGLLVLSEDYLIAHYTLLIVVISVVLSLVIILFFILYFQNSKSNNTEIVKELSIKYKLGLQEEKVLNLLIQDLSNQEIADKLYVSLYTVKNHVANIYRKTGMKKKELKEKCFYGTN
jgi:predicted DNA-binding transcriptional regulator